MTRNMYWISAVCFAIIMLVILVKERRRHSNPSKSDRAFFLMINFTLFNCVQDAVWGLCYSHIINNSAVFFGASIVFHVACVANMFFWLYFILTYTKCKEPYCSILLGLDGLLVLAEIVIVALNFSEPLLFDIKDGEYVVGKYRPLTMMFQDIVCIATGFYTLIKIIRNRIHNNSYDPRHWAVFIASLVPIFLSIFQWHYPDAPLCSMGVAMSCLILYIYVVSYEREGLQHSKELFLQNMSHEIRTSLNSVYGFAQLLSMPYGTWTEEERQNYATHIHNSYNMLDMLLNDLMVSTRYDTHKYSVKITTVDVAAAMKEAVEAVDVCKPASVDVAIQSLLPEGFTIQSDGRRIRQVIQNLLTNACQFINKGKIVMRVHSMNDKVEISVAANVPYSQGNMYFSAIEQNLKDHKQGLGLRLRICQRMAKLLGGRVYRDISYTDGIRYMFELSA